MTSQSFELDQVLAEIVSVVGEVVASEYTSVVLLDEVGHIGQSAEDLPGVPALKYRIRDEGLTNWIVHSRQAVVVDDIDQDGAMIPYPGEGAPCLANPSLVEVGVRSLAGLPLVVQGRLLGVLYQHSLHPGAFHGKLRTLTALANQVAITIENARLFQAEQQQSRRLALLADVARIVATSLDVNVLLQGVAEGIRRHFAYPVVGLFTLGDEGHTLVLRGYSGVPIDALGSMTPGAYRQPVERGIVGYVARSGRSYMAPDVILDPHYQTPGPVDIRSELCVPILENGRPVGVVDVESDRLGDFDEEDQSLLEAVADTVSVGLRNARLYEESQQRLQELTLLNRISVGFGAALNLDVLINGVLEGLHELVGTDRTYFVAIDFDTRTWEVTHEKTVPEVEASVGSTGAFDAVPAEWETLLAGQPFAVSDVTTDPQVEAVRETYRSLGTRSVLLVPVQVGKQLYGALGFDACREERVWHPDGFPLLEGVARQLELALANVYLFEEAQLRADELADALARLAELDRLKDEFIQNVSHELRLPLAIIRGYAEMLEAGELGELRPQQQKPVAVIARRARMVSDLVRDIMLILEAEVSPPEPEPVRLAELTRMAVEDFQMAAEQARLTLHAEIAPHLPPVSGSYGYLRRVLDNLLDNAIKFTPAGGTITVRVWQEGEQVALQVSDTGIGIPNDQLERIFDRFYQVDGSAWRQYGGVGLGLALVQEIVRKYGGRVIVDSQVGQGSKFTVLLPVAGDADGA